MDEYERSDAEVRDALIEQRGFLRSSCEAYDSGKLSEAKRIASAIYVICMDGKAGGNTISLLTQLGYKSELPFLSTAKSLGDGEYPRTRLSGAMFLEYGMIFAPNYLSLKDENPVRKWIPFDDWWQETIFDNGWHQRGPGFPFRVTDTLSRRRLIQVMRSQDNGGHFDRRLRHPSYVNMIKAKSGLQYGPPGGPYKNVLNPHFASVRQIAWELEETLRPIPGGPELSPPESYAEWLSHPPHQFLLGGEKQPIQVRIDPDLLPKERLMPSWLTFPELERRKR